ncbi:MAG: peptidylprolyl isomerase [Verrucomicrobiota bacterium]|nr:peptidylprolyl isomerase [Verrucomicrobiota bacterium]
MMLLRKFKIILAIFGLIYQGTNLLGKAVRESTKQDRSIMRLSNGIAAIAEGQIITLEELRGELEPIIPRIRLEAKSESDFNQLIDKLSRDVLQNMIDRIVILKAAEDKGLMIPESYIDQEYNETIARDFGGDRSKFLEYLKQKGETPREFRKEIYRRVAVNAMRQENRKSQSEISPERIEDFYVKNKLRFYQEEALHLRQIILTPLADEGLAPLRQTANQVIKELQDGANFGDLARKYSQDNMSRRGGDWGWIKRSDIREELSAIAFKLDPGQYSDPVELGGTIFVLYCEAKREEMIQPVSQVRDAIEEVLVGEIARENQRRWIENLRSKAYIRYYM